MDPKGKLTMSSNYGTDCSISDKQANELLNGIDYDFEQAGCFQNDPAQEDPAQEDPTQEDSAQEDPAQEDPEQVGVIGATLTSDMSTSDAADPLSNHDNWPQWYTDGIRYLKDISEAEPWVALLVSVVKLERSLSFTGAVSKCNLVDVLKAD